MQVEFIYGRAGSGKTHCCLQEIVAQLSESPAGKSLLLLVPEHATFKLEKELASTSRLGGFSRAYVMGFRRFAHKVLLEVGGALDPQISDLGKRLLVHKILASQEAEFSAFTRAAKQRNFTETVVKIIEEFKSYQVNESELRATEINIDNGVLKQKVHDLAIIYSEFTKQMAGRYTDAEDCLNRLVEKLPQSYLFKGATVWIDGFTWFNPQELTIIEQLIKLADKVKITLCIDNIAAPVHQQEIDLFHRQWKTSEEVKKLANSLGVVVIEHELLDTSRFSANVALRQLEAKMVGNYSSKINDNASIGIVEAANRRKEVEGLAVDMIAKCREHGYRWRDMAVLVRDDTAYGALLEHVFTDMQIPFFREGKRQGLQHPLAEFLRSLLDALAGFRYEPLFRLFKTGFFPVDRNAIDKLENFVLAYGIRGNRWLDNWQNQQIDSAVLAKLNQTRQTVMEPLCVLKARLQNCHKVSEYTNAIFDLLEMMAIDEQMLNLADQAEIAGELTTAREYEQLWNSVVELFDQLVEVCGEETLTMADYQELLTDGLDGLSLSLIPPSLDYVTITTIEQNNCDNSRAVYIVGVNEGVLPKHARPEGILNDVERLLLNESGLKVAPGSANDNFAERFLVYAALTRSCEFLWISYPLADNEGNGLLPSSLIARLRNWLPELKLRELPLEVSITTNILPLLGSGRQAITELVGNLRNLRKTGSINPAWLDVYNWALQAEHFQYIVRTSLAGLFYTKVDQALPEAIARQLYTHHKKLRGSVTRFEKFTACPFRYFAEYGLKVKPRILYQLQRLDIGKFLHDVMRCYGETLLREGKCWQEISEPEQRERCQEIIASLQQQPDYQVLQSSAQNKHMLSRIQQTAEFSIARLSRFASVSEFVPRAFEKSFGLPDGDLPPLTYHLDDGYQLLLTGQVDRIDCVEIAGVLYYLVIDYKTGKADVGLIDVFYGLKMQLLTYLLAVKKYAPALFEREALPAAMLYCFLNIPVLAEPKKLASFELRKALAKREKMPGWALADVDMLREIDSSFNDDLGFIRFGVKNDLQFKASTVPNVKSSDEFALLIDYVGEQFTNIGNRLLRGEVKIAPYQLGENNACKFCPYGVLCRFDKTMSCYQYEDLPMLDNETIMARISKAVGK